MNEWKKMRDDEYHSKQELSSTLLRKFMTSPLNYAANKDSEKRTKALDIGSATHLAILQPDEFGNQVVVAPDCDRRTTEGKGIYAKFALGLTPETVILKADDWYMIHAMAKMIRSEQRFLQFAEKATHVEIAGFATIDGIACRIKPDLMGDDFILDYKTTTSCSQRAFIGSIFKYGYCVQAAFYQMIASAIDGKWRDCYLLAQEKKRPYDFRLFLLDPLLLAQARKEIVETIGRLALCQSFQSWPGYSKEAINVGLPPWFDGSKPLFGEEEDEE